MGLHQNKKLLHSKRKHQQSEKTTEGMGKNFFQTTYLIKKWVSKIYRGLIQLNINSYNNNKIIIKFKNSQRTSIDIFPKKIYECPTGAWKGAQHH